MAKRVHCEGIRTERRDREPRIGAERGTGGRNISPWRRLSGERRRRGNGTLLDVQGTMRCMDERQGCLRDRISFREGLGSHPNSRSFSVFPAFTGCSVVGPLSISSSAQTLPHSSFPILFLHVFSAPYRARLRLPMRHLLTQQGSLSADLGTAIAQYLRGSGESASAQTPTQHKR